MLNLREEYKIKKQIIISFFCAIIILITPFTVIAQENKIKENLRAESDLEELVDQLRILIIDILNNFGQFKIIKTLCNIILGALDTIVLLLLCFIFGLLVALPLAILMLLLFFTGITNTYLGQVIFFTLFSIFFIWDYNCNFITFPVNLLFKLSINPVISFLEINDNLNFSDDCPCLNE